MGQCFLIGAAPTGAWSGKPGQLAAYSLGGWRFISPVEGMTAYVKSDGIVAAYRSGAWDLGNVRAYAIMVGPNQVVGARQAAIADPSGGTTVDATARGTIGAILTALRAHGLIAP